MAKTATKDSGKGCKSAKGAKGGKVDKKAAFLEMIAAKKGGKGKKK